MSAIRGRIADAAKRSGRADGSVDVIAVVKKAPLDDLRLILREGTLSFLGENRIQDAAKRREALGPIGAGTQWRFIGRLQSNKAKQAAALFDWVDSVDGMELAEALQKEHPKTAKVAFAKEMVERFHGPLAAQSAAEEFERRFAKKELDP
ncbi:MAG: hypothetical protein AAB339_03115, partial [Elusimicrobiota bacterium]